jgi:FkbM family methyltransferase
MAKGAYLQDVFTRYIDETKVNTILELGSRDALDAVELSDHYNADVYSFECNPSAIEICKGTIGDHKKVHLIEKAVWDEEGTISFYPVINGNTGASSCFVAIDDYPYETPYEQEEVRVPAIRLEGWFAETGVSPDLICIDLQGAELRALKGMGEIPASVKYILTEGQTKPMYDGVNLIPEIEDYLEDFGFSIRAERLINPYFGDFLFVRNV